MLWNLIRSGTDASALAQSADAKAQARDAKTASSDVRRELDIRVDHLALVCQAMWELLRDTTGITEEALLQKVQEVDLRDGKRDGRIARTVQNCSNCKRVLNSRHFRCVYCGAEKLETSVFESV